MKKILLSQNKYSIVDDEDFDLLNQFKWSVMNVGYAIRQDLNTKKFILMHRHILNAPDKFLVDHINGDKLDNRKENLRLCTKSQNMMNRDKTINNTSGFKGVYFRKDTKKWGAQIKLNYKNISLGSYNTKEDAVKAHKNGLVKYHKEFARLNKIE